jgi:hypothetical protein
VTLFTTKARDADAKQFINEQKTIASIETQVVEFMAEQEKMDPSPKPVITHHPIDDKLQTGDSRLLGGGMSIQAPWKQ